MGKKKYCISWIGLIGDSINHEHKTISHVAEFADVEEALSWAKTRLSIEVQECDSKGKVIPLIKKNLKRPVQWGFWKPDEG